MKKSVLNKQGKFGVKILWRYTDMAIFVLRCFILTHPVYEIHISTRRHTIVPRTNTRLGDRTGASQSPVHSFVKSRNHWRDNAAFGDKYIVTVT